MANIKKYMKVGALIMAIMMAVTGLTGCTMARDNMRGKIENNLKNDLGEEFKVFWLQGSNFDTEYEAEVSPVSNPDIRFTVYADRDGKLMFGHLLKSSYYSAKVSNDFAQEIIKEFDANGIEAFCTARGANEIVKIEPNITSLNTTVKECLDMNPSYQFFIDVILNKSDAMNKETLNKIVKVLEKENERYPGICIYGKFYFYDDEGYSKSKAYFKRTVMPSDTILRKYDLKNSCLNGIKNNKVNKSVDEMLKDLEENNNAAR